MARIVGLLVAGVLLAAPVRAADEAAKSPLAGSWKFTVGLVSESSQPFYILKFEEKDGKWTGSVIARGEREAATGIPGMPPQRRRLPEATVKSLSVSKDFLRFDMEMGKELYQFEGRLPRDRDTNLLGNLTLRGNVSPAFLEPTTLTSLDRFDLDKEVLARKSESSSRVLVAALGLLQTAAKNKATAAEVRSWADRAVKAADAYGPRWQRNVILRVAEVLVEQKGFDAVALQYARQAERQLENKDALTVQVPVLRTLAKALEKSGKETDAKDVRARIEKLVKIKSKTFAGRKGKSERVVLAELFTCSGMAECSAAGLAFQTLEINFLPKDVVFLEYHFPLEEGPDPLTSQAALTRARAYRVQSVPILMLDGSPGPNLQGDEIEAQKRYDEVLKALVPELEETAGAKLTGSATRKDNKIDVKVEATDVTAKGESLVLRALLVEDAVEYKGIDGVTVHHNVVCAFAGKAEGEKVKSKKASLKDTVDLDKVKKDIKSFLDRALAESAPKKLPLEFKKLRIVAFVQDEATGKVLQTVQIDVK